MNFEICKKFVDEVVLVSDEAMKNAVKALLLNSHVLVEPSGAAPIAALLSGAYQPVKGEKIGLVTSGGNIAYTLLQDLLNETYPDRIKH
jgi:threonine dehydratase